MKPSVSYVSLLERGGYGIAALRNLRVLRPALESLAWRPLVAFPGGPCRELDVEKSRRLARALFGACDDVAELVGQEPVSPVTVLHTIPELWPAHASPGRCNVGCTVWETDALPHHWKALLDRVERILVPCEFNRDLFHEASGKPVVVVPHACRECDPEPCPGELELFRRRHGIHPDRFVFYTIGAWTARKAPWDLVTAYLLAFERRDPVSLVIKTDTSGPSHPGDARISPTRRQIEELRARIPDAPEIVLIDESIPGTDIAVLHAIGDVYVSLARSEGFGLGMFDAATHGNPVICTGWGGQLDYLEGEYSTLLDYTLRPVEDRRGRGSYAPYQNWAHAKMDCAIDALREHFENPTPKVLAASKQAARIRERFDPAVIRNKLLDALRD